MRISDWSSDVCSSDLDRDFYLKENERNTKLQAAYLKHLENVLTHAGDQDAAVRAKAINDSKQQVATVQWDKTDRSDETTVYNTMTTAERASAPPTSLCKNFVRTVGTRERAVPERQGQLR